jgi:hypothetical protein
MPDEAMREMVRVHLEQNDAQIQRVIHGSHS